MLGAEGVFAAVDWFTVKIKGQSCHGAQPHKGVDPINVMAHIFLALQSINSREMDPVDNIVLTELHKNNWYSKIFQHLTIDLPYASKEGHASFVLRPVCSEDVMTARFAWLPLELLESIVKQIAALDFVDSLYLDCTNKPPATFGWE